MKAKDICNITNEENNQTRLKAIFQRLSEETGAKKDVINKEIHDLENRLRESVDFWNNAGNVQKIGSALRDDYRGGGVLEGILEDKKTLRKLREILQDVDEFQKELF